MKKKLVLGMLMGLFFLFAMAGSSFATTGTYAEMVGSFGSKSAQSSFGWNETPWLHLYLCDPGSWNISGTFWASPSNEYYLTASSGASQDIWLSLDSGEDFYRNTVTWDNVKELGLWNLKGVYASTLNGCTGGNCCYTTSFTVTPEPVSSALFLIGSLSLAGVAYKRRKKSSV